MRRYTLLLVIFFCVLSAFWQEGAGGYVCLSPVSDTALITCDTNVTVSKLQKIDSLFQNMVTEKKFNGILLIGRGDSVLYTNFSGYADFQTKRKLTQNSRFEIASVSKQFTAVAILMLYEQGKLKLTDKVQQFIPDFPYSGITVHQLLCHRSGLPEYFKFADEYHKDTNFIIGNDSLLRMLNVFKPKILQTPNKKFEYCNTGYVVLASIVERVSGMKFTDFVRTKIFKPLNMTETCFYYYDKIPAEVFVMGNKNATTPYQRDYMSGIVGDKGIYTTANDLFKWSNALDDGKVLKQNTLEMAFSPKNPERSNCQNYGYGWRIECDTCQRTMVYHGGLWNGYNTLFVKRSCDRTTLIILSNIYNRGFSGKSKDFFAVLDLEE